MKFNSFLELRVHLVGLLGSCPCFCSRFSTEYVNLGKPLPGLPPPDLPQPDLPHFKQPKKPKCFYNGKKQSYKLDI